VAPHLHGVSGFLALAARLRMEQDMEAALRACGLRVSVLTRARSVRLVSHTSTTVVDLASRISTVQPVRTADDYRDDINRTLEELADSHAEQAQFCREVFPSFVQALQDTSVDGVTAMKAARAAFGRILRDWDNIRGTDRVMQLAGHAIRYLNRAVELAATGTRPSPANAEAERILPTELTAGVTEH
jgi:hypothetical protein